MTSHLLDSQHQGQFVCSAKLLLGMHCLTLYVKDWDVKDDAQSSQALYPVCRYQEQAQVRTDLLFIFRLSRSLNAPSTTVWSSGQTGQ